MSREKVIGAIQNELIGPVDDAIRAHLIVNSANESSEERKFKISPYTNMQSNHDLVACLRQGSISSCQAEARAFRTGL